MNQCKVWLLCKAKKMKDVNIYARVLKIWKSCLKGGTPRVQREGDVEVIFLRTFHRQCWIMLQRSDLEREDYYKQTSLIVVQWNCHSSLNSFDLFVDIARK